MRPEYKKILVGLLLVSLIIIPINSLAESSLRGQLSYNRAKMTDIYKEKLLEKQETNGFSNQEIEQSAREYNDYLYVNDIEFLASVDSSINPDWSGWPPGGGCDNGGFPAVVMEETDPSSLSSTSTSEAIVNPEDGSFNEAKRRAPWGKLYAAYATFCTIQYYNDLYVCSMRCSGTCGAGECYTECAATAWRNYVSCMNPL